MLAVEFRSLALKVCVFEFLLHCKNYSLTERLCENKVSCDPLESIVAYEIDIHFEHHIIDICTASRNTKGIIEILAKENFPCKSIAFSIKFRFIKAPILKQTFFELAHPPEVSALNVSHVVDVEGILGFGIFLVVEVFNP